MDPEKLDFEASAAMFFTAHIQSRNWRHLLEAYMWKQVIFAFSNYRNSADTAEIDNIILI